MIRLNNSNNVKTSKNLNIHQQSVHHHQRQQQHKQEEHVHTLIPVTTTTTPTIATARKMSQQEGPNDELSKAKLPATFISGGLVRAATSTKRPTGPLEEDPLQESSGHSTSSNSARKRQRFTDTAAAEASQIGPALTVPLFENHVQFPDQLWELLKYEELKDAIWWMPGNDAFAINEVVFSAKLLESHFRGNKFSSIIRKLNRWGFRKYVDRSLPPKTVAYYHRSFQKGRPELVKLIEKEEGKLPPTSTAEGPASQFCLFPEATTSQRIAHVLQASGSPSVVAAPSAAALALATAASQANPPLTSTQAMAGTPGSAATLSSLAKLTVASSPFDQRRESSILQSIFGQRGAAAAAAASSPASLPLVSSAAARVGANPALPTHLATHHNQRSTSTGELLGRGNLNLELSMQSQSNNHNDSIEQHALLASMVNNIERERQQQRQEREGRLLLALERERERSRLLIQEQKQEPQDEGSLYALMATGASRRREASLSLIQERQHRPEQQEQHNRLLAAAACHTRDEERLQAAAALADQQQQHASQQHREDLHSQLQLHRRLQAAISSPSNPFASPLQTGLARRVLGRDSLTAGVLPQDLLLTPQQRVRHQVLQLQQQQQQQQQHQRQPQLREEELHGVVNQGNWYLAGPDGEGR